MTDKSLSPLVSIVFVPFDRSEDEVARNPGALALHPDWWEVALGSAEATYLKKVATCAKKNAT